MGLQLASSASVSSQRHAPVAVLRVLTFCAIGTMAALVHFAGTLFFVEQLNVDPVHGNVAGYVLGLATSYAGQSRFTFRRARFNHEPYLKFIAASLGGLLLNSLLFAALLRWTDIDYRLALLMVLMFIATLTFRVMDRWVFADPAAKDAYTG